MNSVNSVVNQAQKAVQSEVKFSRTPIENAIMKTKNYLEDFFKDIFSSAKFVDIVIYAGIGFLIGFLFKRFFKVLIVALLITVLGLKGLEYFSFITINWMKIYAVTGIAPADSLEGLVNVFIAWVRVNALIVLSSFGGFVLGYIVG